MGKIFLDKKQADKVLSTFQVRDQEFPLHFEQGLFWFGLSKDIEETEKESKLQEITLTLKDSDFSLVLYVDRSDNYKYFFKIFPSVKKWVLKRTINKWQDTEIVEVANWEASPTEEVGFVKSCGNCIPQEFWESFYKSILEEYHNQCEHHWNEEECDCSDRWIKTYVRILTRYTKGVWINIDTKQIEQEKCKGCKWCS